MIWLLLGLAFAEDPDFRSQLDQAKFFAKRGWMEDARAELEAAATSEDGRVDPEVWWFLTQVRLELGDLAGAEAAAEKAHSYARTDEQLHAASALAGFLRESFGTARVDSDPGGLSTRLEMSTEASFPDPAVAAYLERLFATYADTSRRLPVDLELPVGTYALNGQSVDVTANQVREVILSPDALIGARGGQLWRLDVGVGAFSWVSASTAHGPLGPGLAVGARRLAGAVSVRASAVWRPQPYARPDVAPVYAAGSGEVALEIGLPFAAGPGVWTPGLGYRLGALPGVERRCTSAGWQCQEDGEADLFVYPTALVHGPSASLWFELGDAQRKTQWAPGVRTHAGLGLTQLPGASTARLVDGRTVDYTLSSTGGTAVDLGIVLTLSHGL